MFESAFKHCILFYFCTSLHIHKRLYGKERVKFISREKCFRILGIFPLNISVEIWKKCYFSSAQENNDLALLHFPTITKLEKILL